jgi:predicted nucleic acid-binding protein
MLSELVKKKPNQNVLDWLDQQDETSLYLSVITFGELQKGISKLSHSRRRRKLEEWVDQSLAERFSGRILGVDLNVASRWGEISGKAEMAGRRVPVLDGLLAATALEYGLTLVTGNPKHFEVTGASWVDPARA